MNRAESYVIGIAGGSGAGKTTLINRILEHTGSGAVVVIQHDWYYRHHPHLSPSKRASANYDHPGALETELLTAQLRELIGGRPVEAPQYDFSTHLRKAETRTILPSGVIIIDGILIFDDPALRELMDLKVYVETDPDLRFIRRMERDVKHRGRTRESVVRQYLETVKPMHDQYVEPAKSHADIIITDGGRSEAALDLLLAKIQSLLPGRGQTPR
ncbi:MAG: uridine kinase [Desulfobacter sp.]|nr:MAG: uridine kinase [Desulfobacter sp.]